MAAKVDLKREAPGESPEPVVDVSAQTALPDKTWNPLLVPTELYLREGLVWQPHQPVSLTVEVNGKRDLMKYAAVMQLVPKLGFVARLGQPGAAAKFQNLHLVDVKRRGSTDIHISLGDLAWTQSRASEASVTAAALVPTGLPSSGAASPDISSDAGMAPPDGCVLGGGAADGGLLSGSSSEGTTAQGTAERSVAGTAVDMDAGASTGSQSQGGAASDPDEKATVTSSAAGVVTAADLRTSCSAAAAAAAAAAATGSAAAVTDAATNVPALVEMAAAAVASVMSAPQGSPDAVTARGSVGGATSPAGSVPAIGFCCTCAFCPCHLDPEQLDPSAGGPRHTTDTSPHGSTAADRSQVFYGKSGTPASDHAAGAAASGVRPHGRLPSQASTAPGTVAPSGGVLVSHISRERLRNLCLMPSGLQSSGSVVVPRATASGPGDSGGRGGLAMLSSVASVSLPPLLLGGSAVAGVGAAGVIDRELVLPPDLAAGRMGSKHALVQCEIDGELEDCKMQYRLVVREDGRTLALQGISRPLRGLQLLSFSETDEGDILIRAVTPGYAPSQPMGAVSSLPVFAAPGPDIAAGSAPRAAVRAGGEMVAPAAAAGVPARSASGRQRKPSLKAREGGVTAPNPKTTSAATAPKAASAGGPTAALPPLPPMHGAPGEHPVTANLSLHPHVQQRQAASQEHSKRRGRPPRSLAPPALPLGVLLPPPPQQQHQHQQGLRRPPSAVGCSDLATNDWAQDSQDGGCFSQAAAPYFGSSAKRSRTAAGTAGRAASSSMTSDGGDVCGGEDARRHHDGGNPPRGGRRAAATTPAAALHAGGGGANFAAAAAVVPSGRVRRTSNLCSAASLPPLSIPSCGDASAAEDVRTEDDDATFGGPRPVHQPASVPVIAAAAAAAARVPSAESPSGRGGRKRGAAAGAAVAPGSAAPARPSLEPDTKRNRTARDQCPLDSMDVDCEGETWQQGQAPAGASPRDSPQGSDSAAGPEPALATPRTKRTRTAARRATQQMKQQLAREPSLSSASDSDGSDGGSGDEAAVVPRNGGAAAAARVAVVTGGGPSAGDDADGSVAGAVGGSGAQQGLAAAAAAQRPKPRQRQSNCKSKGKPNRHPSKISNVVRNAGAILLMIGYSDKMYEKQLRATFGNNPDTSKALRLLEEQGKVMRGGLGYRMHPYHYTLTPVGRTEYERLLQEQGPSHAFALTMGVRLPTSPDGAEGEGEGNAGAAEAEGGRAGSAAAGGSPLAEAESEAQSGEAPAAIVAAAAGAAAQPWPQQGSGAVLPQTVLAAPPAQPAFATGACAPFPAYGLAGQDANAAAAMQGPDGAGSLQQAQAEAVAAPMPAPQAGGFGASVSGGEGSSPTASVHSGQQSQQLPAASGEPSETVGVGVSLAMGAVAATTTTAGHCQPPHLLLSVPDGHCGAGSVDAKDAISVVSAPTPSAQTAPRTAASAGNAPASAAAVPTQPQPPHPQMQTLFACPVGYQLAPYPAATFHLAPQQPQPQPLEAVKSELETPGGGAAAGQVAFGNPYAVYSYVPTPFGYMPYPMYGAFAPAANGGVLPTQLMAAPGAMAAGAPGSQLMPPGTVGAYLQPYQGMTFSTAAPSVAADAASGNAGQTAAVSLTTQTLPLALPPPPQFMQQQQLLLQTQPQAQVQLQVQCGGGPTSAVPAMSAAPGQVQLQAAGQVPPASAQAQALTVVHVVPQVQAQPLQTQPQVLPSQSLSQSQSLQPAAAVGAVPLGVPQQLQPVLQQQEFQQATAAQPVATPSLQPVQQSLQPHDPSLPSPLPPPPGPTSPQGDPQVLPHFQPEPQAAPPPQQFKFVQELPNGGYRAEVPSEAGVMYYSPGFSNPMQAAAAADLLMSKLRPGEQLNLGLNAVEAATLGSLTVQEVQAMLWNMADQVVVS